MFLETFIFSLANSVREIEDNFDELKEEYLENQYDHFLVNLSWADLAYRHATKEQIELLRAYGADYLQGFYYSCPLPKDEFLEKVRELSA